MNMRFDKRNEKGKPMDLNSAIHKNFFKVDEYNDLPQPDISKNKIYFVSNGSGGSFGFLGLFKYPSGLYMVNHENKWEICPSIIKDDMGIIPLTYPIPQQKIDIIEHADLRGLCNDSAIPKQKVFLSTCPGCGNINNNEICEYCGTYKQK